MKTEQEYPKTLLAAKREINILTRQLDNAERNKKILQERLEARLSHEGRNQIAISEGKKHIKILTGKLVALSLVLESMAKSNSKLSVFIAQQLNEADEMTIAFLDSKDFST